MNYKWMVLGLCLLLGACASATGVTGKMQGGMDKPVGLVDVKGNDYFVWEHSGRIYVIGNAATSDKFGKHHHLPYTKTLIGEGPRGETVVFEVDKKNPALTERLMATFQGTPYLIDWMDEGYSVYNYQGRLFVLGQEKTRQSFLAHKHLPYTRTLIGAGPYGETVVFEVNKKDKALADRLQQTFESRPFPVRTDKDLFAYKYNERIYVIGQEKTRQSFLAHKHLPYTRTLIGTGPNGETVVFEVDKKNPELAQRLESSFM